MSLSQDSSPQRREAHMSKEEEIAKLLAEGKTPQQLVTSVIAEAGSTE